MPTSAVTGCESALSPEAQVLCWHSARTHLDALQAARLRALLTADLDSPVLLAAGDPARGAALACLAPHRDLCRHCP